MLGHKVRDLGPSLTHVILLCKVLSLPCVSNGDNYIYTPQIGSFLSSMPNIAYQVVKKVLEFSFLNEKEIFSDLQFVPVSTLSTLLLVS